MKMANRTTHSRLNYYSKLKTNDDDKTNTTTTKQSRKKSHLSTHLHTHAPEPFKHAWHFVLLHHKFLWVHWPKYILGVTPVALMPGFHKGYIKPQRCNALAGISTAQRRPSSFSVSGKVAVRLYLWLVSPLGWTFGNILWNTLPKCIYSKALNFHRSP